MNRIHDFITQGIKSFFSVYPNDEIAECCNKLNDYLNPIEIVEYEDFLCQNERLVDKEIEKLFSNIFEEMYIYLPDCFGMLKNYQECEYIEGEKYRDHYYHSI